MALIWEATFPLDDLQFCSSTEEDVTSSKKMSVHIRSVALLSESQKSICSMHASRCSCMHATSAGVLISDLTINVPILYALHLFL